MFSPKSGSLGGQQVCIATMPENAGKSLSVKAPWVLSIWKEPVGVRIFALRAETPASFPQYVHSCKSHFPGAPAGVCTPPSRAFPANQFHVNSARDPGQRNWLDLPDSLPAAMRESGLAAKSILPSRFWEHFLKSHLLCSPLLSLHLPGVTETSHAHHNHSSQHSLHSTSHQASLTGCIPTHPSCSQKKRATDSPLSREAR